MAISKNKTEGLKEVTVWVVEKPVTIYKHCLLDFSSQHSEGYGVPFRIQQQKTKASTCLSSLHV